MPRTRLWYYTLLNLKVIIYIDEQDLKLKRKKTQTNILMNFCFDIFFKRAAEIE